MQSMPHGAEWWLAWCSLRCTLYEAVNVQLAICVASFVITVDTLNLQIASQGDDAAFEHHVRLPTLVRAQVNITCQLT